MPSGVGAPPRLVVVVMTDYCSLDGGALVCGLVGGGWCSLDGGTRVKPMTYHWESWVFYFFSEENKNV